MSKTLIITEKPSVAREYAAILKVNGNGNGVIENDKYAITWCVGHLVEMSYPEVYDEKYKKWNLKDLPFLPEEYKYDIIENVRKQYEIVHKLMNRKDIETILYAGDSGREGQVIAELVRRFGGVRKGVIEKRVWIDSCTEEEIMRGIREAKPMSEYDNLANAGIMRAIEDYAMGINFSRALSVKYGRMLNKAANNDGYAAIAIGRVMTCVLGMVVRREREIRDFVENLFYRIQGTFVSEETEFNGEWKAVEGSKYFESPLLYKENGFKQQKDAKALIDTLGREKEGTIDTVTKSLEKKKPPLLFNLAELQAECSKRFKISPDQTLKIAQELYERKFTTYPRTDARVLTTAIAKVIRGNLQGLAGYPETSQFVQKILDEKLYAGLEKTQYTDDKKVTDHYAIIPTGQMGGMGSLSEMQKNVYDLIVRRFLSIFYPPIVYQKASIVVLVQAERFFTNIKVMKEAGYSEILQLEDTEEKDGEDSEKEVNSKELVRIITNFKKGDLIAIKEFNLKEGKTSPPKRYTSGSMVLAMENAGKLIEDEELRAQIKGAGIGTSATRAEIIDKLVRIKYLNLNRKTQILTPNQFGEMVYEVVLLTIPTMLNPEMTASWEKGLSGMEQGNITTPQYRKTLEEYVIKYINTIKENDLTVNIADNIRSFATGASYENEGSADRHAIGVKCPVCGEEIFTTPFGYGCSGYKADGSGCKFSIGAIARKRLSEKEAVSLITEGELPEVSGFRSKTNRIFSAGLKLEDDTDDTGKVIGKKLSFVFPEPEPIVETQFICPKCQKHLKRTTWNYSCECGFKVSRKVASLEISEKDMTQLLSTGRTDKIDGFKSKAGKKFAGALILNEDGGVTFDFN